MHHHSNNHERSLNSVNPKLVRTWWGFARWVKLSRSFHFWFALPSIPLSFYLAIVLPPEPKNLQISQGDEGKSTLKRSYLFNVSYPEDLTLQDIFFSDSPTPVGIVYSKDYNGVWSFLIPLLLFFINGCAIRSLPSHLFVIWRSKNFTSNSKVRWSIETPIEEMSIARQIRSWEARTIKLSQNQKYHSMLSSSKD